MIKIDSKLGGNLGGIEVKIDQIYETGSEPENNAKAILNGTASVEQIEKWLNYEYRCSSGEVMEAAVLLLLEKAKLNNVEEFYNAVCRQAEANMERTGRLEGAHYAAMQTELKRRKSAQQSGLARPSKPAACAGQS